MIRSISSSHILPLRLPNFVVSVLLVAVAILSGTANAQTHQLPLEAVLGDKEAFLKWKVPFEKWYRQQIDSIPGFTPSGHEILSRQEFEGITLVKVRFVYPPSSPLAGKVGGGVLAIPEGGDADRPIVIAIHGHEQSPWGSYPIDLFLKKKWPYDLAKKGYTVWAPVSMYHDEIRGIADRAGYIVTWVKLMSEGVDYGQKNIWKGPASGYVAAGLSSGALISLSLMAFRKDISAGVFAGGSESLEFLRREYRIKGHPDCWDVKGVFSYAAIQSLIAPRPVQFQLGKQDPFFPDAKPLPSNGMNFMGTSRGQISTEVAGDALEVREIYSLFGKKANFTYELHPGGHELRPDLALKFLGAHFNAE
jgi:hypothetical protein